jgi:YVTN family beta-propeller protein
VTATIPVGNGPDGVAADPGAGTVYVTNSGDNTVSVIDVATGTVTATIPVGNEPVGVAADPATHTAYVANYADGTVSMISAAGPVSGPIVSGYRATLCVADRGDSAANKTPVTIATCNGSPGQDWTVTGAGTLQLNGKCLDIYRDEKTNKAPVELWTCTGGVNQQWHATAGTLVNPVSGKCLDDPRYSTTPGTQLIIYTCNGGANQLWNLP